MYQIEGGDIIGVVEAAPGEGDVKIESAARALAEVRHVARAGVEAVPPAAYSQTWQQVTRQLAAWPLRRSVLVLFVSPHDDGSTGRSPRDRAI